MAEAFAGSGCHVQFIDIDIDIDIDGDGDELAVQWHGSS